MAEIGSEEIQVEDLDPQPEIVSHEEQAEGLYYGVERRVGVINALLDELQTSKMDEPTEKTIDRLNAFHTRCITNLPDTLKQGLGVYWHYEKELEELAAESGPKNRLQDETPEEEYMSPELQSLHNEYQRTEMILEKLQKHDDIAFHVRLFDTLSMLATKRTLVLQIQDDPQLTANYIQTVLKFPTIHRDSITNRIIHPFGIGVVLQEAVYDDAFNKGERRSAGWHPVGSAISFIRDSSDRQVQLTDEHEYVHNVLDASGIEATNAYKDFQEQWITAYKQEITHDEPDEELLAAYEETIASVRSTDIINGVHEEILAAQDQVLAYDMSPDGNEQYQREVEKQLGRPVTLFEATTKSYSTAGGIVRRMDEMYQKAADDLKDTKIEPLLRKLSETLEGDWLRVVRVIHACQTYAKAYNSVDALKDLYIYFIVLKPTQYHHVPKLLERKYGKLYDDNVINETEDTIATGETEM